MDLPQYGEPSSPPRISNTSNTSPSKPTPSRLILPPWDIPELKRLHPSHDFISLLHLTPLYHTHVRPFGLMEGEGGSGKKGKRKRAVPKGYTSLIEDCIDPTPIDERTGNSTLLPLIPDLLYPPAPLGPRHLYDGPIESLNRTLFAKARLDAGTKLEGYEAGVKLGVKEAQEKRLRKRIKQSQSLYPDFPTPIPELTPTSTPGTPLLPVLPPSLGRPTFQNMRGTPGTTANVMGGRGVGMQGTPVNGLKRSGVDLGGSGKRARGEGYGGGGGGGRGGRGNAGVYGGRGVGGSESGAQT